MRRKRGGQQSAKHGHTEWLRLGPRTVAAEGVDHEEREIRKAAEQSACLEKAHTRGTEYLTEFVFEFTVSKRANAEPAPI